MYQNSFNNTCYM